MDWGRPERADRLAAEYVLGTLRGPARRRFEALRPAHPGLRAAEARWQARLVPWALADVERQRAWAEPSARVWARIAERIGAPAGAGAVSPAPQVMPADAREAARAPDAASAGAVSTGATSTGAAATGATSNGGAFTGASSNEATTRGAASRESPRTKVRDRAGASATPWWQRLVLWQGAAAFASLVALGVIVKGLVPAPAAPPIVVVLAPNDAASAVMQASFVASVSADGGSLVLRPVRPLTLEAGRALELWAVPADGAPRSLGLVSAREGATLVRAGLLRGVAAFAVSLEPAGGSPTGAPTGPVLSVGKI